MQALTSLITLIFLSPAAVNMIVNSSFSSAGSTAAAGAAATAAGAASNPEGSAYDITLVLDSAIHGMEGLTLYGGVSEIEQYQNATTHSGDRSEQTWGVTYATGGFTVGFQMSDEETGQTGNTDYENTYYSVTFNVNDDLSIGYNHVESDEKSTTPVTAEADSIQAAYTMGGATFSIAEVDISNRAYGTTNHDGTVLSLGLAF